jgi:MtN3 and saliva related transmembrane protein
MTSLFEILGIAGSLIVCGSVVPQVIRTYKTRSARDLSIVYLTSLMTGMLLLMVYSIHIRDFVFIFGNTLSILSIGTLMELWRRYRYRGYIIKGIRLYQEAYPRQERRNNPCPK